jgi:hypothetical protein
MPIFKEESENNIKALFCGIKLIWWYQINVITSNCLNAIKISTAPSN